MPSVVCWEVRRFWNSYAAMPESGLDLASLRDASQGRGQTLAVHPIDTTLAEARADALFEKILRCLSSVREILQAFAYLEQPDIEKMDIGAGGRALQ